MSNPINTDSTISLSVAMLIKVGFLVMVVTGSWYQANILDSLKGAAGGSGVAALAQQMAQSGQLGAQSRAARIGQQESQNQMAERQMAGNIQNMEREGDVYSRGLKKDQTETLFGMAQQRAAADQTAVAQAKQAKMDAITGGITGATNMFAGFGQ